MADPDSRVSQLSELEQSFAFPDHVNQASQFNIRKISNCSWDCARDVSYIITSGGASAAFGAGAAESSTDGMKIVCAVVSSIFGAIAIGYTIYGITIRCCPSSQRSWFRS